MRKVKLAVVRYLFFLTMQLRIYTTWSKLHRFLFDAKGTQLPTFRNVGEVVPFIRGFVWRPDSWIDLGDAICSAEMVWYRYVNGILGAGDCDEYAVFWANVIQKSIDDGVWNSSLDDPNIMTVTWMLPDGAIAGHNVCIVQGASSNYSYMDYDLPRWCGSKARVAEAVVSRYAPGADLVGWAIHSPKLKKREVYVP